MLQCFKADDKFLDVGCCFGQDIRKLLVDGSSAGHIYGLGKERGPVDLWYYLFRNRNIPSSTIIVADTSNPNSDLYKLRSKMNILFLSPFYNSRTRNIRLKLYSVYYHSVNLEMKRSLWGDNLEQLFLAISPSKVPISLPFNTTLSRSLSFGNKSEKKNVHGWQVEALLYIAPEVSGNRGVNRADPNKRIIQFDIRRELSQHNQ